MLELKVERWMLEWGVERHKWRVATNLEAKRGGQLGGLIERWPLR
jgi:hypothetical protein